MYLSVVTLKVCEHAPEGGLVCFKLLSGHNASPLPAASKNVLKCSVGMQVVPVETHLASGVGKASVAEPV